MARLMIGNELVQEFKVHEALCGVRGDSVVLDLNDIKALFSCPDTPRLRFFDGLIHRVDPPELSENTMKSIRERNRTLEALLVEVTDYVIDETLIKKIAEAIR